jgi:ribosomal protein L25 (general stress protein Ctc)
LLKHRLLLVSCEASRRGDIGPGRLRRLDRNGEQPPLVVNGLEQQIEIDLDGLAAGGLSP